MITADELKTFSLFACLSDEWRDRIAQSAAELSVTAGEWIIREGEAPSFFVLLNGSLVCEKDYGGTNKVGVPYGPGDFYGEIPILLDSVSIASLRATEASRLLRLDAVQFKDMIASSRRCNELVVDVMGGRLKVISDHMQDNDPLRVLVVGSQFNKECHAVRAFLSQNHIAYRWSDRDQPTVQPGGCKGEPFVVVDRSTVVGCPLNVRKVAEALGMKTEPSRTEYDVVIVGGGPAGLASAICGSSEGLDVLLVERSGIGGQAASSSRIENYPGFPSGISGNELGSKALKQATHFGADIVVTREVRNVVCLPEEYCVEIDGGCQIQTRCIVLTTGVQWRKLEATGVERLTGKGVLYGAARTEAHSVLGKKIFIVGGGNSAGQAAMFFSGYASSVTMLVRGKDITHSMSQYLVEQLKRRANIFVETGSEVISAHGEAHLESICTLSNGETRSRQADALFVMIGASADSSWMPKELMRDQHGFIFTGRDLTTKPGHRTPYALETNLPGVFCAGDVRHGSIKRVSSGMGEGSMAIAFIHQYLTLRIEQERLAYSAAL